MLKDFRQEKINVWKAPNNEEAEIAENEICNINVAVSYFELNLGFTCIKFLEKVKTVKEKIKTFLKKT